MIKIGLIGEDPNDTTSITNLLLKKYKDQVLFCTLVKRIRGSQLDSPKIKKSLEIEFKDEKCKFIIYIRDLDGYKSEKNKINKRQKWFEELDSAINNEGILLLNIWELEALIFADINTLNGFYKIKFKYPGDPMGLPNPKSELKRITYHTRKKYHESHCSEIFNLLNFETVEKNCLYFKHFISEFDKKLI
jgi:hypothetical protein